jgi:hypothetical protein
MIQRFEISVKVMPVDDALPGKVGRDNAPSQASALRERALSPAPLIEDLKKIMC